MITLMAFLLVHVATLPRRQDAWGGPLGCQACRRRWLREPVWPEQETHLRLSAAQPETLTTRLHRRAAVFATGFFSFCDQRFLSLAPRLSPSGHRFDYETPVEEVVRDAAGD